MATTWQLRGTSDSGPVDLRFGPGPHIIGSSAECDLIVDDRTISRRHARLLVSDGGVSIEDLGSTNGTAVDGAKVTDEVPLHHEAEIKLGRVFLRILKDAESVPSETVEESDLEKEELEEAQRRLEEATERPLGRAGRGRAPGSGRRHASILAHLCNHATH